MLPISLPLKVLIFFLISFAWSFLVHEASWGLLSIPIGDMLGMVERNWLYHSGEKRESRMAFLPRGSNSNLPSQELKHCRLVPHIGFGSLASLLFCSLPLLPWGLPSCGLPSCGLLFPLSIILSASHSVEVGSQSSSSSVFPLRLPVFAPVVGPTRWLLNLLSGRRRGGRNQPPVKG